MSRLTIYPEADASTPDAIIEDADAIAAALKPHGVTFERWPVRALPADADQDVVLTAYAPEIDRLSERTPFLSIDVIRMTPDHPQAAELRARFLDEHTHGDDEVRYFVEGEGLFTLRLDGRIYALLCTAGDLIAVPAGTRHWFDGGARPGFTTIRLFTAPDGWVAAYTGDPIAARFPRHEPA